ncbi:MAG: sulfurtransferase-like selenium metabolism protein YedF [Deferribacterales bacterium]
MIVDARGKPCPTPVIMTKKALESIPEGTFQVVLDSEISKTNVTKFLESQGVYFEVKEQDNLFYIDVVKGYNCNITAESGKTNTLDNNIVIFISSETIGYEDIELGKLLMKGFLNNIKEMDVKPKTIIFVNTGVKLTTLNEEAIQILINLSINFNVEILNCGTCLEYFKLTDKLKVGTITDAYTVAKRIFEADKVVRL